MAEQLNELGAMLGMLQQGFTPEQARARVDEARAMQFAQLSPSQQRTMMGFQAGQGLGRGISSLFGVQQEDPTVRMATQLRGLENQFDTTTADGMMQYARALQSINPQMAQQAALAARKMEQEEAKSAKTKAEASKLEYTTSQEEKLRKALAELPENATEEDMLRVVRKFGSVSDILKGLETSQNKRLALEQRNTEMERRHELRLEEIRLANEGRVAEARQRGETAEMIARLQIQGKQEIAALQNTFAIQLFKAKEEAKGLKPLPTSLQKAEDTDLATIQSTTSLSENIDRPLQTLKDGTLKLGIGQNFANMAKNALGRSDPQSQAFADLERSVQAATNIKVSAEKGVQTDRDVLRFAKELEAAFGKNDTKVMIQALENFKKAALADAENKKKLINSRRKSQNAGEYDFNLLGTSTPKAEKTVVRTGTVQSGPNAGKQVIEYSDGTREYK